MYWAGLCVDSVCMFVLGNIDVSVGFLFILGSHITFHNSPELMRIVSSSMFLLLWKPLSNYRAWIGFLMLLKSECT